MGQLNKIKEYFIDWLLKKSNLIARIEELKNKEHSDNNKNKITGQFVTLYPESVIHNTQNNPDNIRIGESTHIRGELLIFPYGGKINIGSNSYIGAGSRIWSGEEINIGNNVLIGHNVNIIDFSHERNHVERANGFKNLVTYGHPKEKGKIPTNPIKIEDDVAIYAGANIIMGVTIGKGSVISAGSVVIKNVPPFSLVLGNPGKVVWKIKQH